MNTHDKFTTFKKTHRRVNLHQYPAAEHLSLLLEVSVIFTTKVNLNLPY